METNYRKGNTTLWIALLIMAVFFICCSCGSRKVETKKEDTKIDLVEKSKETVSESNDKQSEENTKIEVEHVVDKKNNVVTETVKVTPIDNTKPSSFKDDKGVIYDLQNSAYEKSIKTDLSNVKEELNSLTTYYKKELESYRKQSQIDKETIIKLRQELKNKNTTAERGFPWWILIAVLVAYVIYRKYKRLPLLPF